MTPFDTRRVRAKDALQAVATGGKRPRRILRPYRLTVYLLLAPFVFGALLLVGVPALLSFGLAFTEYDGLAPPVWVGVANFGQLAADERFWIALRNSLLFVLLTVPLRVLGTLLLALLLNQRRRGIGFYRAAVYLPTVIPSVAYALIWLWIFNPVYGPLNTLLAGLGLPAPAWLADSRTALLAIAIMACFQIGEGFVVLLAGLQEVPRDYFDAAAIDGAGRWQVFWQITLPLIAPWLLLLTMRDIIVSVQSTFAPAFIMTGGGPYYATLFVPLLMYELAFDRFRFGMGAALMLLVFLGVGLLLWLLHACAGGWGYAEEV